MAKFRPHKGLIASLSDSLRAMGAYVDIERYCADLLKLNRSGVAVEAWLDICAQFPGHCGIWRLDVTIRSPWAQARGSAKAGVAAEAGVAAKLRRYGESVNAISMEPLGRMAKSSSETLWSLAQQARDMHISRQAPNSGYRRLRLCLERALLWSVAERFIFAAGKGVIRQSR